MDTTKFDAANKDNVQTVGITDDYDETKVDVDGSAIKAYDSVTGADVTDKFDINVENGVMTATLKLASLSHLATQKILKSLIQLNLNLDVTTSLIFQQLLRTMFLAVQISKILLPKLLTTTTQ